jgi:hypothetical protein
MGGNKILAIVLLVTLLFGGVVIVHATDNRANAYGGSETAREQLRHFWEKR